MTIKATQDLSLAARLSYYSKPAPKGCRVWTGYTRRGYGRLWWDGKPQTAHRLDGKPQTAHRLAWLVANGSLPAEELFLCHHCDNRLCINPRHLFVGTPADNSADMRRKTRSLVGERHPNRRLTAEQIIAIRADTRPTSEVARAYGIRHTYARKIIRGESWKHIP